MASVFKPKGSRKYRILYFDENGHRRQTTGCTDKAESERIAHNLENKAALRRAGLIDRKAEAYRDHDATPLFKHIAEWQANLIARGYTSKHAEHTSNRVRRLVTVILGSSPLQFDPRRLAPTDRREMTRKLDTAIVRARLSLLSRQTVQDAIARFRDSGSPLQTCNHYRAAVRAFSNWCHKSGRTREDELRGGTGFNAKEDRRHDRRTLGLDELQKLIDATHNGPDIAGLTGPIRALCYRLAAASGLRYAELASLTPESFDFENGPSVTVEAAYTKNGQTTTLLIPSDLAAHVARQAPEAQVFPLPTEKGARMLCKDLARAGIPYHDASGRSKAHEAFEPGTDRPLHPPRAVDIESAASMLPSLKPKSYVPEAAAMTGTDPSPVQLATASENASEKEAYAYKTKADKPLEQGDSGLQNLHSPVRIRAAPLSDFPPTETAMMREMPFFQGQTLHRRELT